MSKTKNNQSAEAPSRETEAVKDPISGDTWSIEGRTEDGKVLYTIVRISCEIWEHMDDYRSEDIKNLFKAFCQDVEDLF